MGVGVRSLAGVMVCHVRHCPLARRTSCFVPENNRIGQARFAVGRSILSVPVCLLVLQMFVREEGVLHGLNEAEEGLTLLPFSKVSVTFGAS